MYTLDNYDYKQVLLSKSISELVEETRKIKNAIRQNELSFDHNRVWCNSCERTINHIETLIRMKQTDKPYFF